MTSSLDEKKDLASQWFRSSRDQFCTAFEELDGGKFERKNWNHKGSGGGEISILKGKVFEKVGVNISTVAGEFSDDFKSQIKGTEKSAEYWAQYSADFSVCLLYTSPSPRDKRQSRMPSSA